jgi:hypothetical protein
MTLRLSNEVLKVIVANPTMIKAYKAGVPANGKPFPEGRGPLQQGDDDFVVRGKLPLRLPR